MNAHQAILVHVDFVKGKGYFCTWTIKAAGNHDTVFHHAQAAIHTAEDEKGFSLLDEIAKKAQAEIQAEEDKKVFAVLDGLAKNGFDDEPKPKKKKKAKIKKRTPEKKATKKKATKKKATKKKATKKKTTKKKTTKKKTTEKEEFEDALESLAKHVKSGPKGVHHEGMKKALESFAKAAGGATKALTKLKVTF
jgi:outer membrane biosynthesis protein TonB